jgi:hypothetical protein
MLTCKTREEKRAKNASNSAEYIPFCFETKDLQGLNNYFPLEAAIWEFLYAHLRDEGEKTH